MKICPKHIDGTAKMDRILASRLPCVEGVFEDVLLSQGVFCFILLMAENIEKFK